MVVAATTKNLRHFARTPARAVAIGRPTHRRAVRRARSTTRAIARDRRAPHDRPTAPSDTGAREHTTHTSVIVSGAMAVVPGAYVPVDGDGRCIIARNGTPHISASAAARAVELVLAGAAPHDGASASDGAAPPSARARALASKTWRRRDAPRCATPEAFVMDVSRREVERERACVVGERVVRVSVVCQEGCYPHKEYHVNQDCYVVAERRELAYADRGGGVHACGETSHGRGVCGELLLGVFDGHGKRGEDCAQIASGYFTGTLIGETSEMEALDASYARAFEKVNEEVCEIMGEDASFSGSTAITALFDADGTVRVGNVGDSRCVVGIRVANDELPLNRHTKTWNVLDLTHDQTCFRADERARMKAQAESPMMFATIGMVLGETPSHEEFGDGEPGSDDEYCDDPPRVFMSGYRFPGCAFTRSIGDTVGKALGVSATPEMSTHDLNASPATQCVVIASDGVFEFMSSGETMAIAERHYLEGGEGASERAAEEIVQAAYARWQEQDERADDVTAIVAFIYPSDEVTIHPSNDVVAMIQLNDVSKIMGAMTVS